MPSPADAALGEAVVRQIMNGCRPHHLISRDDVCIEYLAATGAALERQAGSHRSAYRQARLSFMVRGVRNPAGPAALVLNVLFNRSLPANATIVEIRVIRRERLVVLKRRRAGRKTVKTHRWFVTLACRLPAPVRRGDKAVGVALDWKGDGDGGANLAVISSSRGQRTIGFAEAEIGQIEAAVRLLREAEDRGLQSLIVAARRNLERVYAARRIALRTMAKASVGDASAVFVDKMWLDQKGVKKHVAPAEFRQAVKNAAENAGARFAESAAGRGKPSKKRASILRQAAANELLVTHDDELAEVDQ